MGSKHENKSYAPLDNEENPKKIKTQRTILWKSLLIQTFLQKLHATKLLLLLWLHQLLYLLQVLFSLLQQIIVGHATESRLGVHGYVERGGRGAKGGLGQVRVNVLSDRPTVV